MLSNKNSSIFNKCIFEAEKSNLLFKHGCVATYGGKIIASGCNTHKNYSNDCFINNQCSCHAEINVLRKIYNAYKHKNRKMKKIMKNTTLYVSRCSSQGKSTNSAPCMKCLKAIKSFNIKKIIFVLNDEYYIYKASEYFTQHKTFGDKNLELIKK